MRKYRGECCRSLRRCAGKNCFSRRLQKLRVSAFELCQPRRFIFLMTTNFRAKTPQCQSKVGKREEETKIISQKLQKERKFGFNSSTGSVLLFRSVALSVIVQCRRVRLWTACLSWKTLGEPGCDWPKSRAKAVGPRVCGTSSRPNRWAPPPLLYDLFLLVVLHKSPTGQVQTVWALRRRYVDSPLTREILTFSG